MNIIITDNDKRILSLLMALLVAVVFIFLIIRPIAVENGKLKEKAAKTREQANELNEKAGHTDAMLEEEENVSGQVEQVLARFYPMLQSQQAEYMATTLMLNHNLQIQSLSVTMSENPSNMEWYQYSEQAIALEKEQQSGKKEDEEEEEKAEPLELYLARVVCVADGSSTDLWGLLDDISANYPAISIVSMDYTTVDLPTAEDSSETEAFIQANDKNTGGDGDKTAEELSASDTAEPSVTLKTDRLTLSLEIIMSEH